MSPHAYDCTVCTRGCEGFDKASLVIVSEEMRPGYASREVYRYAGCPIRINRERIGEIETRRRVLKYTLIHIDL